MAADNLNVITLKLDQMVERQVRTDDKLSMITERVLNPESGVLAKIRHSDIVNARNREDINELHESVDKLLAVCEAHERSVSSIEKWVKDHEERDNEIKKSILKLADTVTIKFKEQDDSITPLKNDFLIRSNNKIFKDKIIWILISALITALALPPIIKLYKGEFQEKPKVETLHKK